MTRGFAPFGATVIVPCHSDGWSSCPFRRCFDGFRRFRVWGRRFVRNYLPFDPPASSGCQQRPAVRGGQFGGQQRDQVPRNARLKMLAFVSKLLAERSHEAQLHTSPRRWPSHRERAGSHCRQRHAYGTSAFTVNQNGATVCQKLLRIGRGSDRNSLLSV